MSMAYMYMLDVHLFDEVAQCRPNTGSFSTKTIIKKNKNNTQMVQKLQMHANSQCVLEMI